eukprot:scaffold22740_cov139-Cylindrotheca_fusiformis.AAC.3
MKQTTMGALNRHNDRFRPTWRLLILIGVATLLSDILLFSKLPQAEWDQGKRSLLRVPTDESEMTDSEVYEDNNILHIVTTRFMQSQSNLHVLGKARLELFETFCFPSMTNQVIDNFLWFVMVDPNLDDPLLERLKLLLLPYSNFYLILSNEKMLTPETLSNTTTAPKILSGDLAKLHSSMGDLHRTLLLETRLDADDGLHKKTLGQIQLAARELPVETNGWQVICNDVHIEWRNDEITSLEEPVRTSGKLRMVREEICVTPGYTLARHREHGNNDFPPWPRVGHHLMNSMWPKCFSKANTNTTNLVTVDCWTRLPKYPAAIRSRTITSAGMSRIQVDSTESKYDSKTEALWKHVLADFGITSNHALTTSRFLKDNINAILKDNLEGQW